MKELPKVGDRVRIKRGNSTIFKVVDVQPTWVSGVKLNSKQITANGWYPREVLIRINTKKRRECWANIYAGIMDAYAYSTREEAEKNADHTRDWECVHFVEAREKK